MARGTPRSGQRSVYQKTPVCYLAATWDPENKRLFYGVLMLRLVFILCKVVCLVRGVLVRWKTSGQDQRAIVARV